MLSIVICLLFWGVGGGNSYRHYQVHMTTFYEIFRGSLPLMFRRQNIQSSVNIVFKKIRSFPERYFFTVDFRFYQLFVTSPHLLVCKREKNNVPEITD